MSIQKLFVMSAVLFLLGGMAVSARAQCDMNDLSCGPIDGGVDTSLAQSDIRNDFESPIGTIPATHLSASIRAHADFHSEESKTFNALEIALSKRILAPIGIRV